MDSAGLVRKGQNVCPMKKQENESDLSSLDDWSDGHARNDPCPSIGQVSRFIGMDMRIG